MTKLDDYGQFNELSLLKQRVLIKWIDNLVEIKTFNPKSSSYYLKHLFERSSSGFYVTNGAFKGAMKQHGFKSQIMKDTPNEIYNVSEISIKKIKKSLE